MEKFITSHRFRVKRAKEYLENSPEKISIIDREAFVELFLLDDISRLYQYRLNIESSKKPETRGGEIARRNNINMYTGILNIFKTAIEIASSKISSGHYRVVSASIPEHALMAAASNIKHIEALKDLGVRMLKSISMDTLEIIKQNADLEESLDDIETHHANVLEYRGANVFDSVDDVIKSVEAAFSASNTTHKSKADKPDTNY